MKEGTKENERNKLLKTRFCGSDNKKIFRRKVKD